MIIDQIKQLREETAASVQDCKRALEEAKGDFSAAKVILKKRGKDLAGKKSSRETNHGIVDSYIHPNKKLGVILELNCETDFVARSKDFQNLAHELCLQIAAFTEDIPLLKQAWVKDPKVTVKDLIEEYIAKVGENIIVKQYSRYQI